MPIPCCALWGLACCGAGGRVWGVAGPRGSTCLLRWCVALHCLVSLIRSPYAPVCTAREGPTPATLVPCAYLRDASGQGERPTYGLPRHCTSRSVPLSLSWLPEGPSATTSLTSKVRAPCPPPSSAPQHSTQPLHVDIVLRVVCAWVVSEPLPFAEEGGGAFCS